ncbi:hypothetical protein TraAM80_01003 [Trypanosoma rangeli]|uniref:Transmembrane protein n=1 Tax=Trypanosoma rangeli TaxID=5698 RepID=A0A3R7KQ39_TRYRA|nr:uncharacterized protein TraAM80_01003 [Trypanosoma rangeli]RNF11386.1 hypothetical protein TraAM80_01003 [Trypanosoma rangeli]|eukprot:RNF11386.1 hypothetical protein TraAM80_01003 [Trypanosoma rangeli]
MSTDGVQSKDTTSPKWQAQPVRHACTHQGFQGILTADASGCSFTSDLLKVEFVWENVKWIRVTTKYIKDEPTSVLVLKLKRGKRLTSRLNNGGKHYFYHLMDIVEVSKELQELKDSASNSDIVTGTGSPESKTDVTTTTNAMGLGDTARALLLGTNSDSSLANCNQANQASPVGGNTIAKFGSPLQPGGKTVGSPQAASCNVLRQEDDLVSSSSTGRLRRPSNIRDDGEEGNDGRNSGAVGVNVPLTTNAQRHGDSKNNSTSQLQRGSAVAIINRKRRGRQRESDSTLWSRCHVCACSIFPEGLLRVVVVLGVVLLVILTLALSLCVLMGVWDGERWYESSPGETVVRVTRALEQLRQWRTEPHTSGAIRNANRGASATVKVKATRSAPPVRVTLKDMTVAVEELLARYVAVQHEMIVTRVEHVRREHMYPESTLSARRRLLDGVPLDFLQYEDENWENIYKNDNCEEDVRNADVASQEERHWKPLLRFSAAHVKADLSRLLRYAREAIAVVKWALSRRSGAVNEQSQSTPFFVRWLAFKQDWRDRSCSSKNARETQQITRYTEVLASGQIVAQEVKLADHDERRTCLRLTRELIRLSSLIEELLLEYQDVVMAPLYEAHLHQTSSTISGVDRMHKVLGAAVAGTSLGNDPNENGFFSGDSSHLLRSILLRRHTLALLYFDPLQTTHDDREHTVNRQSHNFRSFSTSTNKSTKKGRQTNSTEAPTKEDVRAILRDFVASTTDSSNMYDPILADNYGALPRNILREMKYWYEHEEEWQTVVLWRLNSINKTLNATQMSNGARKEENEEEETEEDDDDFHNVIDSLPLFRGLWCFMRQPIRLFQERGKRRDDVLSSTSTPIPSEHAQKAVAVPKGIDNEGGLENGDRVIQNSVTGGDEDSELVEEMYERRETDTLFNDTSVDPRPAVLVTMDPAERPSSKEEHRMNDEMGSTEEECGATEARIRTFELISEEAQIRWINAFDLFLRSHEDLREQWAQSNRGWDGEKSHEWDVEEGHEESNVVRVRRRFVKLLGWVEHHYEKYLTRDAVTLLGSSGALLEFAKQCSTLRGWSWWTLLWPPSWFLGVIMPQSTRSCWMLRPRHVDPAVRRLYRNMLHVPLGDIEDLPLMLLQTLSMPSELLKSQHNMHTSIHVLCWLLLLVVLATVVIVGFHC